MVDGRCGAWTTVPAERHEADGPLTAQGRCRTAPPLLQRARFPQLFPSRTLKPHRSRATVSVSFAPVCDLFHFSGSFKLQSCHAQGEELFKRGGVSAETSRWSSVTSLLQDPASWECRPLVPHKKATTERATLEASGDDGRAQMPPIFPGTKQVGPSHLPLATWGRFPAVHPFLLALPTALFHLTLDPSATRLFAAHAASISWTKMCPPLSASCPSGLSMAGSSLRSPQPRTAHSLSASGPHCRAQLPPLTLTRRSPTQPKTQPRISARTSDLNPRRAVWEGADLPPALRDFVSIALWGKRPGTCFWKSQKLTNRRLPWRWLGPRPQTRPRGPRVSPPPLPGSSATQPHSAQ